MLQQIMQDATDSSAVVVDLYLHMLDRVAGLYLSKQFRMWLSQPK